MVWQRHRVEPFLLTTRVGLMVAIPTCFNHHQFRTANRLQGTILSLARLRLGISQSPQPLPRRFSLSFFWSIADSVSTRTSCETSTSLHKQDTERSLLSYNATKTMSTAV